MFVGDLCLLFWLRVLRGLCYLWVVVARCFVSLFFVLVFGVVVDFCKVWIVL